MNRSDRVMIGAIRLGIAVPILYFGIQFAAAPFYPGYSFLSRDASTLGSSGSTAPAVFNYGVMLLGLVTLVASVGLLRGLGRLGVSPASRWLAFLAVMSCGLGSINASLYPLPDPRHTSGMLSLASAGTFLLPFALPAALWKWRGRNAETAYFAANMLAIIPLAIVMSSLIQRWGMRTGADLSGYQYFLNHYHGLLQRVVAAIVFGPVAVAAQSVLRRLPE